ncbi:MAG: tyrosine recombinase [Clostridiales Family XIII bacterium]|jgi:integrase/recombinase XerD|nr:tyrosine recombinase [Clostridiales Family XIII bacterium]
MENYLQEFEEYLTNIRKLSTNSISAYLRDLPDFKAFLEQREGTSLTSASNADIAAYLLKLRGQELSTSTINRKLASVRAYYKYLIELGIMSTNPATGLKSPKVARKEIEYLSLEEIDRLLSAPDDSDIGVRDVALLEILYATGIRATEVIYLNVDNVNLRMGFVTCDGSHGKARIIPLGRPARKALEEYIFEVRDKFLRGENRNSKEKALFLNYYGERITRQAIWKILRNYAAKADIEKNITPQILRNSFAVHMIQNGADLKSLQELMGHEDPSATQAYLQVTRNRIKDVYDRSHPRA